MFLAKETRQLSLIDGRKYGEEHRDQLFCHSFTHNGELAWLFVQISG